MPKEQENAARFLLGEGKPANHNARRHERVRGYIRSGRSIGRVRVVRQPLTDYQRYQFAWGIPGNIKAGEDTQINREAYEGDPAPYREWQRLALEHAVPFEEYVKGLDL
jgi:hypothetical protein